MVVSKLVEAINLLVPGHEEIHQNKIITIDKELTKNKREVKSQIRPDIWFWSEHDNTKNLQTDATFKLHLVEVKVPWGGIYENEDGKYEDTLERIGKMLIISTKKQSKLSLPILKLISMAEESK
jgi:hypothetical protein